MKKYIIKNCPARFDKVNGEQGCTDNLKKLCLDCYEVSDCLLKRIVEIFKDFRKDSILINGNQIMVEEILNLLEIEEVE